MNEFNNSGIILNKGQVKGEGVWSRSRERGCGIFFGGNYMVFRGEQWGDQLLPTEYKWETIENLLPTRGNHKNITELYVGIR